MKPDTDELLKAIHGIQSRAIPVYLREHISQEGGIKKPNATTKNPKSKERRKIGSFLPDEEKFDRLSKELYKRRSK